MSNFGSFAELIKRGVQEKQIKEAEETERKKREIGPLLSELFSTVSKGKELKQYNKEKESPLLEELQAALSNPKKFREEVKESKQKVIATVEKIEQHAERIQEKLTSENSPVISDLEKKFLKLFNRLQNDFQTLKKYVEARPPAGQSFGGGGSGEVRILRMDDINVSDIAENRMLVWNSTQKKFRFVDVPIESNLGKATLVTSVDYTPTVNDYYIGVNSENIVTITLPNGVSNGREYIIKDESGNAQLVPIKILGNVDNDPDGVELRINNGSVTVIYRNGWRII